MARRGRPKKYDEATKLLTALIPQSLWVELDEYAKAHDVTKASVVVKGLRQAMRNEGEK